MKKTKSSKKIVLKITMSMTGACINAHKSTCSVEEVSSYSSRHL